MPRDADLEPAAHVGRGGEPIMTADTRPLVLYVDDEVPNRNVFYATFSPQFLSLIHISEPTRPY